MSKIRTIKRMFGRNVKKLAERELHVLNKVLKPKPRWMPKFAWRMVASFVLDEEKLTELSKKHGQQ